jgi:hypothetical protein
MNEKAPNFLSREEEVLCALDPVELLVLVVDLLAHPVGSLEVPFRLNLAASPAAPMS